MTRVIRVTVKVESASTDGSGPLFVESEEKVIDGRNVLGNLLDLSKVVSSRFDRARKDYAQRHGEF